MIRNSYVARRQQSGCPSGAPACWVNTSAFAPAGLIQTPNLGAPLASDFTTNLNAAQVACGVPLAGDFACVVRKPDGSWVATPSYWPVHGLTRFNIDLQADMGQSGDLSRVFFEPGLSLLASDTLNGGGLYELSGLQAYARGEGAVRLRLVNMDDGTELRLLHGVETPLLGDAAHEVAGTAYEAISQQSSRGGETVPGGETAFFTAEPSGGGPQAIYARISCAIRSELRIPRKRRAARCRERGAKPSRVSASECEGGCAHEGAKPAIFQGASADGSKVFFTTEQELLPEHKDTSTNLYEYDFSKSGARKLTLLSRGNEGAGGDPTPGEGAEVSGVVRTSSAGSRAYFVAAGVLSEEPNSLGQKARPGGANLYVVDTLTDNVSFIATLAPEADKALWGEGCTERGHVACDDGERRAQLTPDGSILVFDTHARLDTADANACHGRIEGGIAVCEAQAVYRFDAATGALTWISHGAPNFPATAEAKDALIGAPSGGGNGGMADFADTERDVSGCPAGLRGGTRRRLRRRRRTRRRRRRLHHL